VHNNDELLLRVKIRFEAVKSLIKKNVKEVIIVNGEGRYLLTRMFDLIYLGDWISYYLAVLNKVDPTPIPLISKLKSYLSSRG
jgi:glucose/mannose-6-phosphate isomerase